ncbi:MAG: hypothetical protein ACJ8GK_04335 [Luteimonas sp.]
MQAAPTSAASGRVTRKRWLVLSLVAALVLGSYAAGLAWVARRLEIDMQKSIHAVPAAVSGQRVE